MSNITVVIPTYNRAAVLLQTLDDLFAQTTQAREIILVDQTDYAADDTVRQQLQALSDAQKINWQRRETPSIPAAMNHGLCLAETEYVLFLDDDIRVETDFITLHVSALQSHSAAAQVGQILQPGQIETRLPDDYRAGQGLRADLAFPFNSASDANIYNCMAGNLCVRRSDALAIGGFDERFSGVAYRFETEFCRRLIRYSGAPLRYVCQPTLHHLQASSGGTRSKSNHLTASSGIHSSGDYYFALLEGAGWERIRYIAARLLGAAIAKFYLRRPWYIPVRWLAELRGLNLARQAYRAGQLLIDSAVAESSTGSSREDLL